MAIGNNAKAVGGIAIGANSSTNGLYGVALGQSASVAYRRYMQLGYIQMA